MLHSVSFTGRETMLTPKKVENAVSKLHEYVSPSKIYSSEEVALAEKLAKAVESKTTKTATPQYTSPFAPTEVVRDRAVKLQDAQNGFAYNVAHGKPASVAKESAGSMDIFV